MNARLRTAGSIILRIAYGYQVADSGEDPLVTLVDNAGLFSRALRIPLTTKSVGHRSI